MRVALALALVVLPLSASAAPAGPTFKSVHTLVRTRGAIDGFAQDGDRIAWLTRSGRGARCVRILHVRSLSSGRTTTTRQPGCLDFEQAPQLALAGRAAVWQNLTAGGNTERDVDVWTAEAGARNAKKVEHLHVAWDLEAGIAYPELPTAGAARILVYDAEHDGAQSTRAIRRIVGGKPRTLFWFDRPVSISVAGKRIAVVRQVPVADTGGFVTQGDVRSLSGARIAGLLAPGSPQGVALGARGVAVLTRTANVASISVFEAATGRLRRGSRQSQSGTRARGDHGPLARLQRREDDQVARSAHAFDLDARYRGGVSALARRLRPPVGLGAHVHARRRPDRRCQLAWLICYSPTKIFSVHEGD
jgi:hypothetical protein